MENLKKKVDQLKTDVSGLRSATKGESSAMDIKHAKTNDQLARFEKRLLSLEAAVQSKHKPSSKSRRDLKQTVAPADGSRSRPKETSTKGTCATSKKARSRADCAYSTFT